MECPPSIAIKLAIFLFAIASSMSAKFYYESFIQLLTGFIGIHVLFYLQHLLQNEGRLNTPEQVA